MSDCACKKLSEHTTSLCATHAAEPTPEPFSTHVDPATGDVTVKIRIRYRLPTITRVGNLLVVTPMRRL